MRRYRVVYRPKGRGKWAVEKQGSTRALKVERKKLDAIDYAKKIAKNNRPSVLVIEDTDEGVNKRHSYPVRA